MNILTQGDRVKKLRKELDCTLERFGKPLGVGKTAISKEEWSRLRSKFYCPIGITNVWQVPQLRSGERLKINQKAIHLNQKPLLLIKRIIEMSSDVGDVVWDPFAGLCTSAVASLELERECFCAEVDPNIYQIAVNRVTQTLENGFQCSF